MTSFDTGPIGFDTGPIELMIPAILDPCNARSINIYVDREKGQIWRLVDPMSPTEKLPVVKEWTDERKVPWYTPPVYEDVPVEKPGKQKPPTTRKIPGGYLCHTVEGSAFKFDKPLSGEPESAYLGAFTSPDEIAQIRAVVANAQATPPPAGIRQYFLMFGHADMTNTFEYNHGLSMRRNRAVQLAMGPTGTIPFLINGRINGAIPCSDFNPKEGPSDHEFAAETAPSGVAGRPAGSSETGNVTNRRHELFIIRDYADPQRSAIQTLLNSLRNDLKDANGITDAEWPENSFPCSPGSTGICRKLSTELRMRTSNGEDWRHCQFYKKFKEGLSCLQLEGREETVPGETTLPTTVYERHLVKEAESGYTTEVVGEYHPPPGEHYGYYMDEMVKRGVYAGPAFPPRTPVAPNNPDNPLDFNLIKAGSIKVVKMDVGFWGDQRKLDVGRKAGFRREPARSFGVIEGPFVWLCFFETAETAGLVEGCSDSVDSQTNPLMTRFMQAAADAGHQVKVLKKAVAEAGPAHGKLLVFLPDMHLPRRPNEEDADYASDRCVYDYQMVRSMVVQQLRRDYWLPYEQTPWLSVEDRVRCLDFFEHDAPTLKLPVYSTARRISNPFDPQGGNFIEQAADAALKAYQALMQFGFYMFEFTQDDLRREVKSYPANFPEAGRGRTHDILNNWFYGFDTDRNVFGPGGPQPQDPVGAVLPEVVTEIADAWGADLGPDKGTAPAQERFDNIDAGPARDLLRLLKVIEEQNDDHSGYIRVFHTGDLYELWVNRRYQFEDFRLTDDPVGRPEMVAGLDPDSGDGIGTTLMNVGKFLGSNLLRTLLGGLNASEPDVWYRREIKRDPPAGPLPSETYYELQDPQLQRPQIGPGSIQVGGTAPVTQTTPPERTREEILGAQYVREETRRRMREVEAFEAPIRDGAGRAEDLDLLAGAVNGDQGRWNEAIIRAIRRVGSAQLYGNNDCQRGLHGGNTAPFHSEENLWVEHGHRFEDSNLDGQPFGAFVTNMTYDIMELALFEGLLDEFISHREQSLYQPGLMQWFLLTEFGLDTLPDFKERRDWPVPDVHRFRIAVSGHTHVPDLVVAEFIFRAREKSSLEFLITDLGAIVKGVLLIPKLIEWIKKWTDRYGWEKLWEDIKGNTINWGVDFAGLARCADRVVDYLENQAEDAGRRLEDDWNRTRRDLGI